MPTPTWTRCSRASSKRCWAGRPAPSADSLEQPRPYFFPAPARQGMHVAQCACGRSDGERLEFSARRENLGADLEFGGARIDDLAQAFDQRLPLGSGARILTGFLIPSSVR